MNRTSLAAVARRALWGATASVLAACCFATSLYSADPAAENAEPAAQAAPSSAAAADRPAVPGEYAIAVRKNADLQQVRAAVEKATGYSTTLAGRHVRLLKLKTPPEAGAAAAAAAAKVEGVVGVEPNYLFKPARAKTRTSRRSLHASRGLEAIPSDPQYLADQSWYLNRIEAPEAWDIQNLATDVVIAVIDDGILYDHLDLEDRMWENEGEDGLDRGNGEDDDNNGYIDDTNGWDFFENDNDPSPYDDPEASRSGLAGDRGTFVAGVAGAEANNGEGIAGLCWSVRLMNLRVFDETSPLFSSMFNVADAIDYAIEEEADVILIPWVDNFDSLTLSNAMDATLDAEILVVCAAGDYNSNVELTSSDYFPANYDLDNQITVLATIEGAGATADARLATSNYGPDAVHLGAPGEGIWGCDIDDQDDDVYRSEDGTHGAAALVAGAAALVYAINPDLDYDRVKSLIEDNVDPVASLDGFCSTGGRLNLYQTLNSTPPPTEPPPPPGGGNKPDKEAGRDFRELGAQATVLLGNGFYYAYLDLANGPKSTLSNDAYNQAQQAYYYALLAGTVVYWDNEVSPGKAFAGYSQIKYGQLVYSYYATSYAYYSYTATGDEVTGAAALYLYYSTLYSYYDIQTPPELKPTRARDKPKNRRRR
ncbi:MAG TPA: S8 family serine peptidase [Pirellulaceae bacterium]|jgi:subtilisin family serine protease|nr:S8 family serine peptidase [Pirellulaceae bacterium]